MLELGQKYSHTELESLGYFYIVERKNISVYCKHGFHYYVFHDEVLEHTELMAEYVMGALLSYVK
jgi:hypothetical protein